MTHPASETTTDHAVRRITVTTARPFEALRRDFEATVPALDLGALERQASRGATWGELERSAGYGAAYDLCRFWTHDPSALLHLAGNDAPSRTYLIGNLAMAARLFRIEPGTALHAPLRIELHVDRKGATVLSFDQPGSQLAGYGLNKATQAGYELDRLLGDLLEALGLPRPAALRR
ncbi:hypothetical protein [Arthrobacter sp. JSM 101049]|uniref:hypothetical protein n=1 Tax=Arthrobacter sp. JSM 101049 TaxID=929097 RepID=UPI0035692B27